MSTRKPAASKKPSGKAAPSRPKGHTVAAVKSGKAAKPAKPAKPAKAAKAGKSAKAVKAAKSAKPVRATRPSKVTKPVKASKPSKVAKPVKASKASKVAKPVKASKPSRAAKPVKAPKPASKSAKAAPVAAAKARVRAAVPVAQAHARHGKGQARDTSVKSLPSGSAKLLPAKASQPPAALGSKVNLNIKPPPVKSLDDVALTRDDGRYALPATTVIELPKGYKPKVSEEYMNPRHLAYFRNKLRDWREQLVEESRQTMDNLRDEVRDVGDDAERATRETENSLELRTRDRYRKLIAKIDKALRRIEEGRYGYCEETDEEIGLERLEARPIATLSLDAQERREHLQKQIGD